MHDKRVSPAIKNQTDRDPTFGPETGPMRMQNCPPAAAVIPHSAPVQQPPAALLPTDEARLPHAADKTENLGEARYLDGVYHSNPGRPI